MPLAGFHSTQGDLAFIGVVLAGAIGSAIGGFPLYYLDPYVGVFPLNMVDNSLNSQ